MTTVDRHLKVENLLYQLRLEIIYISCCSFLAFIKLQLIGIMFKLRFVFTTYTICIVVEYLG